MTSNKPKRGRPPLSADVVPLTVKVPRTILERVDAVAEAEFTNRSTAARLILADGLTVRAGRPVMRCGARRGRS